MNSHSSEPPPKTRRPYEPPAFEVETLYEVNGLACGKCLGAQGGDPDTCGINGGIGEET
jgi:hypothetical protein